MKITTVKEAAEVANYTLDNARFDEVLAFLRDVSSDDALTFMQLLIITKHDMYFPFARAVLDIRLAEESSKTAEILKRYTGVLVRLQWVLVWLTVALLVFTVGFAVFH